MRSWWRRSEKPGKNGSTARRAFVRLSLKTTIFAILAVFHVDTDTGHHYDQKSSYGVTVQLIGNAPGGATIVMYICLYEYPLLTVHVVEISVYTIVCTRVKVVVLRCWVFRNGVEHMGAGTEVGVPLRIS